MCQLNIKGEVLDTRVSEWEAVSRPRAPDNHTRTAGAAALHGGAGCGVGRAALPASPLALGRGRRGSARNMSFQTPESHPNRFWKLPQKLTYTGEPGLLRTLKAYM